jgi:hypothetical protein
MIYDENEMIGETAGTENMKKPEIGKVTTNVKIVKVINML